MVTIETFQQGDVFRVYYAPEQYAELELIKIREGAFSLPDVFQKPFSLLFKCEQHIVFDSGIHTLVHPSKGEYAIGISAVVPPPGQNNANYYEAVFS